MKKYGPILIIIFLLIGLSLAVAEKAEKAGEEENWALISEWLKGFLINPYSNFYLIEKIDDLFYWTTIYVDFFGVDYVNELFSNHFKVKELDKNSLDIIYSLLEKYSYPSNRWERSGIKPIVSRIVEFMRARPDDFLLDLIHRPNRKQILKLIRLDPQFEINLNCFGQANSEAEEEIFRILNELEKEERSQLQRFEEFLKDPVNNFEQVADIYFICSTMARRDRLYVNENKILPDEYFSPGVIEDYLRKDPDERKIRILIHLISSCTTPGVESYVIAELGSEIFVENPKLFARVLKQNRAWRSIIYLISDLIYSRDPGFKSLQEKLGNEEFELLLKDQLKFLSKVIEKRKTTPNGKKSH